MNLNCKNPTKDQLFIENVLTKNFYREVKTVASVSSLDVHMFDFATLEDALFWVKLKGAEYNSPNGIELALDKGAHMLRDNDILGDGLTFPGEEKKNLLYLRDMNLLIKGAGVNQTKIVIENKDYSNLVFENMKIAIEQLSFKITAFHSDTFHYLRFIGCEAHVNAVGFTDLGVSAEYGTTLRLSGRGGSAGFCAGFTIDDELVVAKMGSYIHLSGFDFQEKSKMISAFDHSYVYMYHNYNDENLEYNITKNQLSTDMSLIYDHNAKGVYTTNLTYTEGLDHARIDNSSGDGVKIPVVTTKNMGLMTKEDKIKLDNIKPQTDDECIFKFHMWNAEATTDKQTTFIIDGFSVDYMKVFINGVLVRNSEYTVSKGYSEMSIVFHTPRQLGDWLAVEYVI